MFISARLNFQLIDAGTVTLVKEARGSHVRLLALIKVSIGQVSALYYHHAQTCKLMLMCSTKQQVYDLPEPTTCFLCTAESLCLHTFDAHS